MGNRGCQPLNVIIKSMNCPWNERSHLDLFSLVLYNEIKRKGKEVRSCSLSVDVNAKLQRNHSISCCCCSSVLNSSNYKSSKVMSSAAAVVLWQW